MAGSTPLSALQTALLSSALVALLGACSPNRDTADAPATVDPASAAAPADPAGSANAPTQPVDGAMSTAPATDAADPEAICNADGLQALVGQQATETVTAKATADSGATSVRVLGPDDAATMDFREDRLNIHTDAAGVIQSLNCG
ncbi:MULTISPECIES: I78 family peptidase inhibitor [unclassified Luteimonas]